MGNKTERDESHARQTLSLLATKHKHSVVASSAEDEETSSIIDHLIDEILEMAKEKDAEENKRLRILDASPWMRLEILYMCIYLIAK